MFGILPIKWPEHLVQHVKKCAAEVAAAVMLTLHQSQKVVHTHIHIRQEFHIVSPQVRVMSQFGVLFHQRQRRKWYYHIHSLVQFVWFSQLVGRDRFIREIPTVSVAVKNKGGEFLQPMGNVRGMATIGSSLAPLTNMRPSLGDSFGRTPIR